MTDKVRYLETLKEKHQHLKELIQTEYKKACPDTVVLSELKKRKLALKDRIANIRKEV